MPSDLNLFRFWKNLRGPERSKTAGEDAGGRALFQMKRDPADN
jgi:hypothetical protein